MANPRRYVRGEAIWQERIKRFFGGKVNVVVLRRCEALLVHRRDGSVRISHRLERGIRMHGSILPGHVPHATIALPRYDETTEITIGRGRCDGSRSREDASDSSWSSSAHEPSSQALPHAMSSSSLPCPLPLPSPMHLFPPNRSGGASLPLPLVISDAHPSPLPPFSSGVCM